MTEQSMVQRVATAIKADLGRQMSARPLLGDTTSGDWHAESGGVINLEETARAAIAAMRDPDEAMRQAADAAMNAKDCFYWGYEVRDESESGAVIWQAMVDEALR